MGDKAGMTPPSRLLRSALFVPAANARALEKSRTLRPDALIFDLEDSAAPGEKAKAREALRTHLSGLGAAPGGPLRIVRINALSSAEGTEDLLAARACGVDAILLPKVESAETLREAAEALDQTDAPRTLAIWAMIETPFGLLEVSSIARQGRSLRLEALVVGPNDIALATGIRPGPERTEMLPWLMQVKLAASAHGLLAIDGVYADFRDAEGFARECAAGRRMGYDGKTLIHPAQVEAANAAFSPSAAEIAEARAIVAAFAQPDAQGRGVVSLDGRMVERLHLEGATRLLAALEQGGTQAG